MSEYPAARGRGPGSSAQTYEGTRVLIVDDHQLFAEVMRSTLEGLGMEVVGVVGTAEEAVSLARAFHPELVLMDLGLPDEGGLEAGRRILVEEPRTKVIAVTAHQGHRAVGEAIRSGFQGYVTKDTPIQHFVSSIGVVLGGQVVVPRQLGPRMAGARTEDEVNAQFLADLITPQERRVLQLLTEGASSQEIARHLSISRNTVRTHVQNILTKLQVHSRLEAAAFAVRYGLAKVGEEAAG